MVRHASKFACGKRNLNVTSCLLPSKRKRESKDDHWLSQIDPTTVMKLVYFRPVSWIWENKRDYISQLPDDILMNILSRLTMEERARTSILSSRWRDLWTSVSCVLEFDNSNAIKKILSEKVKKPLSVERDRFAKYVNQVLESHHDRAIKELKICFDVSNATYQCDINSWIKFAIQNGVKRFQLDLTSVERNDDDTFRKRRNGDNWEYRFPSYYLGSSCPISLTALHLKYVQVTGEVINNILCTCPLLEVLSIVDSSLLKNLKVCGPSLKLKYLEIICDNVKNIEVSAPNLESFKYCGGKLDITLVDVPSLNEVCFGGDYGTYLVAHKLKHISRHLSQLETLRLDFSFEMFVSFHNFPELCKLKQLHLTVYSFNEYTLLSCISLIEASPLLHRFSLQFEWSIEKNRRIVNQKAVKRHQSLKVVELIGFKGLAYDLVLAKYLIEYAKPLEKIIIDPSKVERGRTSFEQANMNSARRELESILPPNAKLVIF